MAKRPQSFQSFSQCDNRKICLQFSGPICLSEALLPDGLF
jgi:hypothetical protein